MQRYRVNYVLLVALIVGFFVSGGAAYGIWRFQIDRNASRLLAKADAAEASGNLEEASASLQQYCLLRPKEMEPKVRLGHVSAKVAEQADLKIEERVKGYGRLAEVVRESDDPELRRKLADIQMKFRSFDLALGNIDQLLDQGHGDAELKVFKGQCLFATQKQALGEAWCYKLIGFDKQTDAFDSAKAEAPNNPLVYMMLATYLHESNPELARRIIEQMTVANPESSDAYVMQYQYCKSRGQNDEARAALAKAFELNPEDASVLNAKGAEAIADFQSAVAEAKGPEIEKLREEAKVHLGEAARFFAEGIEKHPDRIDFFERAAQIETYRENPKEALKIADQGIAKFPLKTSFDRMGLPAAIGLVNIKIDVLMSEKDFDGVKKQIAALRELSNERINAVADFHAARLAAVNEKWADAAASMIAVRPKLLGFPELQAQAAFTQGFCQGQLGQFDLARDAYKAALDVNPNMQQARAGFEQMSLMTSQPTSDEGAFEFDRKIKETLARPKAEQDWNSLTKEVDAYIDKEASNRVVPANWAASRKALLRGQMYAMRAVETNDPAEQTELFKQARNAIVEASKLAPDDPAVVLQAIRLVAQEPDNGPVKALALLDSKVKKNKDTAQLRALRVELLSAIRDEQLPAQLNAATQGMEDFSDGEKAMVWSTVAARFEQMGRVADAQRCLEQAAALAPNSLPMRNALFELSLKQNDDPGMRAAQEKILEIVKSKTDPGYVLTEVKRRIAGFNGGSVSREELVDARKMIEAAVKKRDGMSDLYVVQGQLALLLDQNVDAALKSFEKAFELGASNLNAIVLQIRLLAERGRLPEARQRMDRIPMIHWSATLGTTAADVLAALGENDKAFVEAEKVAQSKPEDAQVQTWFAGIASQAGKPEAAEAAMKKAIAINPEDPDAWTRLVGLHMQANQPEKVESTLREAFLALDDEYLPLLTAKYYELQSFWQQAEDIYLSVHAGQEDQPHVARRLAEFYLQWSSADKANRGKAAVYINKLLRAANEGKLPENDPNGPWARRQAARLLATTGDLNDSLKAEKLLAVAIESGKATPEDQEQLIDLLSLRPDPASRQRAIDALRALKKQRGSLTPERELQIGHLLYELNDWNAAKKQMLDVIGRYPNDERLQTAYVSMLIGNKEFDEASLRITRLSGNEKLAASLNELRLRLAAQRGDEAEVRKMLVAMTPNLATLTDEQLKFIRLLSQTADGAGDHQYALKLMQEYNRRAPDGALELARLNALYGNVEEGMASLRALAPQDIDKIAPIAVEILRKRRGEAPEKLDEAVSQIVRAALRDDPESARRLVLEAEVLEIQEKFDESVAAYKRLLARDDVPKLVRAAALNNLAYLLALNSKSPEDLELAVNSATEAVALIGPISDVLDTRALALLKQGKFEPAVEDMKQAVKMNATASKYYHLASALLGAGDEAGALAAWKQAKAADIGPDAVSKLEHAELEAFTKKIEQLAAPGSTAQLN